MGIPSREEVPKDVGSEGTDHGLEGLCQTS